MDPITLAITTALANLGQNVIKDAYDALKAALRQKFGVSSDLVEAVGKLEDRPDLKPRQALLQEAVQDSRANEDPELQQSANALIEKLKQLPSGKVVIKQDIKIAGDRNIVTGQGDVKVNE